MLVFLALNFNFLLSICGSCGISTDDLMGFFGLVLFWLNGWILFVPISGGLGNSSS